MACAKADGVKVRLLGTAAGGGLPQWNCACFGCADARRRGAGRTQDCLAVSGDGQAWYLLNASPDLRTQLLTAPELTPGPGRRETPLRGVLLSTAELDHTLGLLSLREATQLTMYASLTVLDALDGPFPVGPILRRYTEVRYEVVAAGRLLLLEGGLEVLGVPVGSNRPLYANDVDGDEWVTAYRITDTRTGGTLVYAPCLPAWTPVFEAAIAGAGYVILDGTFLHDDEMRRSTGHGGTATALGHLPISTSLPLLRQETLYTHLNNTNPMAWPDAPEWEALAVAGARVPFDGETLTL